MLDKPSRSLAEGDLPLTEKSVVRADELSPSSSVPALETIALEPEKLTGIRLHILSTAFSIATFMIAIDRTIIANAIPKITTRFHSLEDVGWYGSAYLLTQMSTQPTFGRVYVYFDSKTMYLLSLAIFELGSILCAVAPNSPVFILGRSIAGIGSAGMLTGSLAIYGQIVPLRQRPAGMAVITAMYGIAGLLGPPLGGVFTDTPHLTWRFCFWINLPFGVISALIIIFVLVQKPSQHEGLPFLKKLQRLDPAGAVILTSSLVCLFLALEWGGTQFPWSASRVWGCLIGFGILAISFVVLQAFRKEKATIPLRILKQRTVAISCTFSALYSIAQNTHSYYLPIYFQAVKGTSASLSGAYGLPFTIVSAICTISVGFLMTAYGHYIPFMWAGSIFYVAGSVMCYLLEISSGPVKWVGCQILTGMGFGISVQVGFIAVQVVTPPEDMPTACAWEVFFKCLGGAIGISIAQSIFSDVLYAQLDSIDGLSATQIIDAGASGQFLETVKAAYNEAVTNAFILAIAATSLAGVVCWGMEWRQIEHEDTTDAENGRT